MSSLTLFAPSACRMPLLDIVAVWLASVSVLFMAIQRQYQDNNMSARHIRRELFLERVRRI